MNNQVISEAGNPKINININKKKRRLLRRVLIIAFTAMLILGIGVFAIMPYIVMKDMVDLHVNFKTVYTAEQYGITSEKLSLTSTDGLKITAYEVEAPSPKAVVIFLSGIHNPSVTAFFGHSAMLQKEGYASILCEMRAHGESEGEVISCGYKEYLDAKAVVDYIKANKKYSGVPIVIYGLSMGATTAINSIGEIPEIDGLISMSAFSSWEDTFADNMANMGIPRIICNIEKPFVRLYCGSKYGFKNIKISPKNEIKKLGNRPALIYHSKGDSEVPYQSYEKIMASAKGNIKTWVKDGNSHFPTDYLENPEQDKEYTKKIMDFLENNFGKVKK